MKTLPLVLGALGLMGAFLPCASAQNGFNSSPMPNAGTFGNLHSPPGSNLPPTPQAAPSAYGPGSYGGGAAPAVYPGAAMPSAEPIDPNHRLGRGDRLSFRVVEDRDDKIWPLFVTDSGEVDVPLIGRVRAAGKSTTELQSDIKSQLEREYYYHATVIMGLDNVAPKASRGRVYVTGAVRAEGAVELPTDEPLTVGKAIAKVGGFKDFANQGNVAVQRRSGPALTVNVKAIKEGKAKDVELQPEDLIVVKEKFINF